MKISKIYYVFIFVFFACVCFWALPFFVTIPGPSGPFSVGLRHEAWNFSDNRLIDIHIFYPSKAIHEISKYIPLDVPYVQQEVSKKFHIPLWLAKYLFNYSTHAHLNAPPLIQEKKYPVIIFSHGIGSINHYNAYLEELVSHGYIVVAITHPGDVLVTVFPDKKVVFLNSQLKTLIDGLPSTRLEIYEYRKRAHQQWCKDVMHVISEINKKVSMKNNSFFPCFDIHSLGVWGHSHGGGVALDMCARDSRIKAGIDMDGWTKFIEFKDPQKPFLFLLNEEGLEKVEKLHKQIPSTSLEKIKGAKHGTFSDLIFIKKFWSYFFDAYSGDNKIIFSKISSVVRTFFDSTLKKKLNLIRN